MDTFVIENAEGKVTDLISYYNLPSQVLKGGERVETLNAVYGYYMIPGMNSLSTLFKVALLQARDAGADVFNALDVMENRKVFDELKFGPGDGALHYYLYNWNTQ